MNAPPEKFGEPGHTVKVFYGYFELHSTPPPPEHLPSANFSTSYYPEPVRIGGHRCLVFDTAAVSAFTPINAGHIPYYNRPDDPLLLWKLPRDRSSGVFLVTCGRYFRGTTDVDSPLAQSVLTYLQWALDHRSLFAPSVGFIPEHMDEGDRAAEVVDNETDSECEDWDVFDRLKRVTSWKESLSQEQIEIADRIELAACIKDDAAKPEAREQG